MSRQMRHFRASDQFVSNFPSIVYTDDKGELKFKQFGLQHLLKILDPLISGAKTYTQLHRESYIALKLSYNEYLKFAVMHKLIQHQDKDYKITDKGRELYNMFMEDIK